MNWINLFLLILASFRLTHLVVYDEITEPLRRPLLALPFIGSLIACYWCSGVWMSLFLLLLYHFLPVVGTPLILFLAVAGGAALLETYVQKTN